MHEPDDFGKLSRHFAEEAKGAVSSAHSRMLEGLSRFYASLAEEVSEFTASETGEAPKPDPKSDTSPDSREKA